MQTITIEPLRWQDDPVKLTVIPNDSHPEVYYQVTSPQTIDAMCIGRPVEELPRILAMIGPAHHLASTLALDRLFDVEPPELAQNMREALLQAQVFSTHLRKLYFLLTIWQNPFGDFRSVEGAGNQLKKSPRLLENVTHHLALSQEAETILGGRHDHPLTPTAGGVSRFLKEEHYERLAEIAEACLEFSVKFAATLREQLFEDKKILSQWLNIAIPALPSLSLTPEGTVRHLDAKGNMVAQFPAEEIQDKIGLQSEKWTYLPYAYLKESGWQGLDKPEGLFFVGPLARLNANQESTMPLAEEERQRMIETLGAPPTYTLVASLWAMAIELIQAAETIRGKANQESLAGPSIREIPKGLGSSTWSAVEAPQGLIAHRYEVDDKGIVKSIDILDPAMGNNALKSLLAKQLVTDGLSRKEDPATIKDIVSVGVLPF